MHVISLQLADAQFAAVCEVATQRKTAAENVILELIERGLARPEDTPRKAFNSMDLESFIPNVGSGIDDLATNPVHMADYGKSRNQL